MAEVTEALQLFSAHYVVLLPTAGSPATLASFPFSVSSVSNLLVTSLNTDYTGYIDNGYMYSIYLDGTLILQTTDNGGISGDGERNFTLAKTGIAAGSHTLSIAVVTSYTTGVNVRGYSSLLVSSGM